jgi:ketosteroid isomerase-like protein
MGNKEILIKANNAVEVGDYEGFLAFCTEDTRWTFLGDTILEGKESVRQWMVANYLKPPKFDVKNLIAENEYVTAIGEIKITNEDGEMRRYHYCDVWQFRDGKMTELTAFVIETKE